MWYFCCCEEMAKTEMLYMQVSFSNCVNDKGNDYDITKCCPS